MSDQMTADWIEQEYNKWGKSVIESKRDAYEIERSQYIAQLFALHILELSSQFIGDENNVKNG